MLFAVLGTTIGSKTPREDSGVIEEIEIGRAKDGSEFGKQHVHVLFKDVHASVLDVNIENLKKIREYRDRIKHDTLYRDYTTESDLISYILKSLQSITQQYQKKRKEIPPTEIAVNAQASNEGPNDGLPLEVGFLDYMDLFEKGMAAASEGLEKIGAISNSLNYRLSNDRRTEVITNAVSSNYEKKVVIDEFGRHMANSAKELADVSSDTQLKFFDALSSFRKGIVMQNEDIGLQWKKEEADEFLRVCDETKAQIENLGKMSLKVNDVLASLPRATGSFNRGKKELLSANVNIARMSGEMSSQITEVMDVVKSLRSSRP